MIPKPTLLANFDSGEGDIGNIKKWAEVDALLRLDLLKDWISGLEDLYLQAYKDLHEDLSTPSLVEKSDV